MEAPQRKEYTEVLGQIHHDMPIDKLLDQLAYIKVAKEKEGYRNIRTSIPSCNTMNIIGTRTETDKEYNYRLEQHKLIQKEKKSLIDRLLNR